MEERNAGTKKKSPKENLTNAKDIRIKFPEGRKSPYHRLS